jgi:hypothetical protein
MCCIEIWLSVDLCKTQYLAGRSLGTWGEWFHSKACRKGLTVKQEAGKSKGPSVREELPIVETWSSGTGN